MLLEMQCCGQKIDWGLIVKLYETNTGAVTSTPGLSLVPKLKLEHVRLTNFSKMRVDLVVLACFDILSIFLSICRYLVRLFPKLYFLHLVKKPMKLPIL